MIVGIDASNLKSGGGLTHLFELISAADVRKFGISKVVVWGSEGTLSTLPGREWLEQVVLVNRGLTSAASWQLFGLHREARRHNCSVVLVPGGNYVGTFKPFVTMSRNMLPFDKRERARYPLGLVRTRFWLLRRSQELTFRRAAGLIFLTAYARDNVLGDIGRLNGEVRTIPHGVSPDFSCGRRAHRSIEECSDTDPFRIIYVSHVSYYKHQWHVIEAVSKLRKETGWPLVLDFVGGAATRESLSRFLESKAENDPSEDWCFYHGKQPYNQLNDYLSKSDMAVFASSCENMPNTLIEKMAAGLPIACSDQGPMPECLAGAGLLFNPEQPKQIFDVVRQLIVSRELRESFSTQAVEVSRRFSWVRCADETFRFLSEISKRRLG